MDVTLGLASATLKQGQLTAACRASFWQQLKQACHFRHHALISGHLGDGLADGNGMVTFDRSEARGLRSRRCWARTGRCLTVPG